MKALFESCLVCDYDLTCYVCLGNCIGSEAWFAVAVSAADSAGTETDRSRRLGLALGDMRKTLHRKLKKF